MKRSRPQTDFNPTENAAAWHAPGDGESTRLRGSSEPVLSGLRGGRRSYSGRAGNRPISNPAKMLTLENALGDGERSRFVNSSKPKLGLHWLRAGVVDDSKLNEGTHAVFRGAIVPGCCSGCLPGVWRGFNSPGSPSFSFFFVIAWWWLNDNIQANSGHSDCDSSYKTTTLFGLFVLWL